MKKHHGLPLQDSECGQPLNVFTPPQPDGRTILEEEVDIASEAGGDGIQGGCRKWTSEKLIEQPKRDGGVGAATPETRRQGQLLFEVNPNGRRKT